MSNFVELNTQEKETINGGMEGIIRAITDWIGHLIGLDDPDREPLFP